MLASRLEDHDTRLEAGKRVQAVGSRWPPPGGLGPAATTDKPSQKFCGIYRRIPKSEEVVSKLTCR